MADVFVGLTNIEMEGPSLDLGSGVSVQKAQARFLTPLTLENLDKSAHEAGLRPAYWQFGSSRIEVCAELKFPMPEDGDVSPCIERARVIVLVIRLWCDPSVTMPVISNRSFSDLSKMKEGDGVIVQPLETSPRYFQLFPASREDMPERLQWVRDNWMKADHLYRQSQEFRVAADAINSGQFVQNDALALISLWGSLEALFSPSTSELKFRVSALIAAYLEPPGPGRMTKQKEIAALYDKRSAAAHGRPRHSGDDLLKTFDLTRMVLLKIIREERVPTKEYLETCLFGAS